MPCDEDYEYYLTETAKLAAETPADDPRHTILHDNMNDVLDQLNGKG
ncbi:hypothetical protein AB0I27_22765 [Streptomyces sp. NPDC050597]